MVPDARLVKAGNTLAPETISADPREDGGSRVILLPGEDIEAQERFGDILAKVGFAPIDLGGDLVKGGRLR